MLKLPSNPLFHTQKKIGKMIQQIKGYTQYTDRMCLSSKGWLLQNHVACFACPIPYIQVLLFLNNKIPTKEQNGLLWKCLQLFHLNEEKFKLWKTRSMSEKCTRVRWFWPSEQKMPKIKTGHMYSYVKLNFRVDLFSCIFLFEAIFCCLFGILYLTFFTREKWPK